MTLLAHNLRRTISSSGPISANSRRRPPNRLSGEGAQATVEFALVLTLFLFLVFGVTQFGLALNTANDETHLADEAARYAAVNYNPATNGQSLVAWIKSQADTTFSGNGTVCISFPNGTSNIGDPVLVKVTSSVFNWQPLTALDSLVGQTLGLPTTIAGQAYMRLEAPPTVYSAGCA